ncbi:MAG: hypothetical protein JO362_15430 [Streptomycetaceae bacterium]|nr:hypothetical protein [Streptomycetaceae bacterium]
MQTVSAINPRFHQELFHRVADLLDDDLKHWRLITDADVTDADMTDAIDWIECVTLALATILR